MKTTFLSTIAALTLLAATTNASAAPLNQTAQPNVASSSLLEPVGYRSYCGRWASECRARWGFSWRYRRCMAIRGCA